MYRGWYIIWRVVYLLNREGIDHCGDVLRWPPSVIFTLAPSHPHPAAARGGTPPTTGRALSILCPPSVFHSFSDLPKPLMPSTVRPPPKGKLASKRSWPPITFSRPKHAILAPGFLRISVIGGSWPPITGSLPLVRTPCYILFPNL